MNIDDYVKTRLTINSNEGVTFSKKIATAKVEVTFWGGRVVSVDRFEGCMDLDKFAEEMLKEAKICCKTQFSYRSIPAEREGRNLSATNRLAGIKIIEKTRELYRITDTKLAQASWFTRLCHWARSFFTSPTHRQNIESAEASCTLLRFQRMHLTENLDVVL